MKNRILVTLTVLLFSIGMCAQLPKTIQHILRNDTILKEEPELVTDSMKLVKMHEELTASRLNEANARLEMENLRLQTFAADSLKHAAQKARIDSLRQLTEGVPVVVEKDTLFYLYTNRGGYTAQARALQDAATITKLGTKLNLQVDSVYIVNTDIVSDIMYGNEVLVSFTDKDGLWAGCSRQQLAQQVRKTIVDKLKVMHKEHNYAQLSKQILFFILVLLGQFLLFRLIMWGYNKLKLRIQSIKDTKLKPIFIQDNEILNTQKQVNILVFLANMLRYLLLLVLFILTIPLLFSIFPQTKPLAIKILLYMWNPLKGILKDGVDYIPNLFTILIIYLVIRYVIKGLGYLARELDDERLKIRNFYPDWAMPTYQIIRFLLYAFMIAMIYPYLPGSDSGVFQGISVFVGLIVSLGSTTVIGNIIAGLVITYMRPFKIGDRIKLNDTVGNVEEKTAFVTRLRTPKNEVVTIPNSFIMSSHTINYSVSARQYGLIIHSEVTIGYDAPWRTVNQLLIDAALVTPGVEQEPKPFVLETSLNDWYPVYQINAYIKDANQMADIYSALHENIQDFFNKAGVEIMSPQYVATRDGNETTIPKEFQKENQPKAEKK